MIIETFKNLIKNYKNIFIAMGIIYIFAIFSVIITIGGSSFILSNEPNNIIENVKVFIIDEASKASINEFFGLSFYSNTLNGIFDMVANSGSSAKTSFVALTGFSTWLILFGYKTSISFINYLGKNELANANTKRGLISFIVKLLIGIAFSFMFTFFTSLWVWSSLILLIVYLFDISFETLFTIRFVYFSNKDRKKILNIKNASKIILVTLFLLAIVTIIASLIWLLSPIIAIIIAVPLYAYIETVVEYTTIKYLKTRL